jgi:VanZ family protein
MPSDLVPRQVSTFDKAAHFSMYAVLAGLLTRHLSEVATRWRAAAVAVALAVAFGAIDEWHQRYIPGRSTELADWHADSIGAVTGALLATFLGRRRDRTIANR